MLHIDTLPTETTFRVTSRQDRLEARMVQAIRSGSPRSALREIVVQLVDGLRLQGVPAPHGVAAIADIAARASTTASRQLEGVADLSIDVSALVATWASARYGRAD